MFFVGVFGNEVILTIVEASTNQYPTSLIVSPEIQNTKVDKCCYFLRQLSSGVLEISHMDGAPPFTCPRP